MELASLKHLSKRVSSRASGLLVVIYLLMISFYSGMRSRLPISFCNYSFLELALAGYIRRAATIHVLLTWDGVVEF